METIRTARDDARNLVKIGVNPNDHKKATKIELQAKVEATIAQAENAKDEDRDFIEMYEAWLQDGVARKDGNAELRRSFEKDVLPALGEIPVRLITEHNIRQLLRSMVDRGVNRSTECRFNDLVQLFEWAEKRQPWRKLMIEGNPVDLVEIRKVLPSTYDSNNERKRILSAADLQELRDIFIEMESTYDAALVGSKYSTPRPHKKTFQLALWICLSTLSRIGELLMAKWEDVDLELGHWEIPISNVKGSIGKKSAHLVSLSSFAISQFKSLHILTGHTKYLFPSMSAQLHVDVKTVSKLVGDSQCMFKKLTKPLSGRRNDNSLALNKGLDGDWNTHDLRRTGATMMQSLGIDLNVIDRCQNHVLEGSKVRRSYLHHKYHDEKKIAWQKLSDELDAIFSEVPKVRLGRKVLKSPSIATTYMPEFHRHPCLREQPPTSQRPPDN